MATIVTLQSSDLITNSRSDINTSLANLNSDKIETSTLDTDTALAANSDSKIATQKATKAYVDSFFGAVTIETTTGVTHSLTTTAGQKVIVWAKGQENWNSGSSPGTKTLTLKYNSVTKDTVAVSVDSGTSNIVPFSLMYTETPGAATQNITVETSSGSISNVVIIVMKVS